MWQTWPNSLPPRLGEFLKTQALHYLEEVIEGVWFGNSHYDADLGACRLEGDDLVC